MTKRALKDLLDRQRLVGLDLDADDPWWIGPKASVARPVTEAHGARSIKFRREDLDDGADVSGNVRQGPIEGNSIAQAYLSLRIHIHVHLWIGSRNGDGNLKKLCFRLQRNPDYRIPRVASADQVAVLADSPAFEAELKGLRDHECGLQEPMFVVVRKVVQKGNGVRGIILPSLVWLEPLDQCAVASCETVQQGSLDVVRPKVPGISGRGKRRPLFFDASRIHEGEFEDEIVERRSIVVDGIAGVEGDGAWQGSDPVNGQVQPWGITADLTNRSYSGSLFLRHETTQAGIEGLQVLIAPSEPSP